MNLELQSPAGTIYRKVTVMIIDATEHGLTLNTFAVTGGQWDPAYMPKAGQQINPGDMPMFVNYTDKPYTGVSGVMTFVPNAGGLITTNWTWNYGSSFQYTSTSASTTLSLTGQVTGQTTTEVTLQFTLGKGTATM